MEVLNMSKNIDLRVRTNWENYVYIPTRERLEARLDDCLYEINWIWNEQHRCKDDRFEDELPNIWKRIKRIKEQLREHYGVEIKLEINRKSK